jgi:hypothetical protein
MICSTVSSSASGTRSYAYLKVHIRKKIHWRNFSSIFGGSTIYVLFATKPKEAAVEASFFITYNKLSLWNQNQLWMVGMWLGILIILEKS